MLTDGADILVADGRIALPPGSEEYSEQCQRLRAEGVTLVNGRVRNLKVARTLDEQVWGPPA